MGKESVLWRLWEKVIVWVSVFKHLPVFLALLASCFCWEIPIGSGLGKLSAPGMTGSDFALSLPYCVVVDGKNVLVLDPFQKKIMNLDPMGVLLEEIDLNVPELLDWHPIDSFRITNRMQFLLLSPRNAGLLIWEPERKVIRIVNRSGTDKQLLQHPHSLEVFQDYFYVSDLLLQRVLVFSELGNALGGFSLNQAADFLPFSVTEILLLGQEEGQSRLSLLSMSGSYNPWYKAVPYANDEHSSFSLIGRDEAGNVYIERYGGRKSGLGIHLVEKLNPLGIPQITARVEVSTQDSLELSQRFVLVSENHLYQLHLQNQSLVFKGIRLH